MTRIERLLVHGGTIVSGASGLAYAAFKYLMVNEDPFSAFNHPLQPWALKVHVIASPLLVFGVGAIFKDHVLAKMRNGAPLRVKRIGLVTLALFLAMALSGYLLQVLSGEASRWWTAWIHIILGVLFLAAYAAHLASVAGRTVPGKGDVVPGTGDMAATGGGIAARSGRPMPILSPPTRGAGGLLCLAILAALVCLPACVQARGETQAVSSDTPVHRLVGILDYIGADYSGAVRDGRVIDSFEHQEQIAFAGSALAIASDPASGVPVEIAGALRDLEDLCRQAAPAGLVQEKTRGIRRLLIERFGLIQSPDLPPSLARGAALYASHCAACHGAAGDPPGDVSERLKPPPRRLSEREVLGPLSPYRVYNALAFGVEGTAMPSFDALAAKDRWDLSFFVFTLRGPSGPGAGGALTGNAPSLATLAASSDDELRERLRNGEDPAGVEAALDALRLEAPFSQHVKVPPLARARHLVDEAMDASRRGEALGAEGLLVEAYLSGIEPAEGPLRAVSSDLASEIEESFFLLRAAVVAGRSAEAERRAGILRQAIGRAEYRLDAGPQSAWFIAASSAVLILREGIEAALLVLLLLAAVSGAGRPEAARYVHAGWASALAAGGVTFAVTRALTARVAASAEIIEAIASLLAAAVLFYVSHWLLGRMQASQWAGYIKSRARSHVSRGRLLTLCGLAFLAVYREAVETILFFEGLLAGGGSTPHAVAGALSGACLLAALVMALKRVGGRVPPRVFFTVSGILLYSLCVMLAGRGVRALVAAGWLAPRPLSLPSLPALGIYPEAASLSAQAVLLLAVAVSLTLLRRRAGISPPRSS